MADDAFHAAGYDWRLHCEPGVIESGLKQAAEVAGANLLIAVGGGSVIGANRMVAIYLAEPGDPFKIMIQHPEGKPAYSP